MRRVEPQPSQQRLELFALREPADDQGRGERAEVDAHVEEREAGVAARVAMRVESPDERADARLKQPGAEGDEDEPGVERGRGIERQQVMPGGDDESADENRAPGTDKVVCKVASEDAHHVARHGVVAVNLRGQTLIHPHPAHRQGSEHEQQENRPHAVVGKPFPHLGVEQHAQPAGVASDAPMVPLGMLGGGFGVGGQLVHRRGL